MEYLESTENEVAKLAGESSSEEGTDVEFNLNIKIQVAASFVCLQVHVAQSYPQ